MVFSSTFFLFAFLPLTILGYYMLRKELRNLFLVVASLFFYAVSDSKSIWLLMISIAVNYVTGLLISKLAGEDNAENKAHLLLTKSILIAGLIFNFSILLFYKYFIFSSKTLRFLLDIDFTLPIIGLPLGISFFTFRAASYLLDIYRRKTPAQKNPIDAALYISFFPQVTMGPITKYSDFAGQLKDRIFDGDIFCDGVKQIVLGLFKKVVFADCLGSVVDKIFAMPGPERTVLMAWLGIIGYLIQLYYDFSGYSDIAIGLGKLFGFSTPKNFDYPYASKSIAEFWRRWHITLGTWFREYVYIPLGGNRKGTARTILNLLVVWVLTGIWHGSTWNYVVWGLYQFVFIACERLIGIRKKERQKIPEVENRKKTVIHLIFAHVYAFIIMMLGWVIFRADSLGGAFTYIGSMFGLAGNSFVDTLTGYYWARNIVLIVVGGLFCFPITPAVNKLCDKYVVLFRSRSILRPVSYAVIAVVAIAFVFTGTYQAFIYFQF